jgi:hypothetical protein
MDRTVVHRPYSGAADAFKTVSYPEERARRIE